MTLSRDYRLTTIERLERDPAFAEALLSEALELIREGDTEPARTILRDLLDVIGEKALPELPIRPPENLQSALPPLSQPIDDDLLAVANAIAAELQARFEQRGRAAIDRTIAAGDGIPAQAVIAALESKLAVARSAR